ncbi:MAG: alkaline phosphatase family protein [Kofleriaceae bacterium]
MQAATPRLVVLLVIDQWPEWSFEAKQAEFHAGGFDRLLREGTWHVGRHPSAVTLTAPGHSLLGTGQTTSTTGIVANEWWHRDSGRMLQSVEAEDGTVSPKWLRVAALGDAVAAASTGAKAVSVSLKDRAAVLPLGHHGTAIWYHAKTLDWTSNTHPAWLDDWNRSQPPRWIV